MKKYTIHPTLYHEVSLGNAWISDEFRNIRLIRIKNIQTNNSIIASYRLIDDNFKKKYEAGDTNTLSSNPLIIDQYFRNRLSVKSKETVILEVIPIVKFQFWYNVKYLLYHPNDSIRISSWLAIFAIFISFIPYILDIVCAILTEFFS